MKVAFVCPTGEQCGIVDYSNFLKDALTDNHADLSVLPLNDLSSVSACRGLSLAVNTADILHLQYDWSFFGKNFFQRLVRSFIFISGISVPKVATIHEFLTFERKSLSGSIKSVAADMLQRALFSFFDVLIVHTEEGKKYLLSIGISQEKIFLMMHPVPAVFFDKPRFAFENSGKKVLTVFGFLAIRKGVHTILPALNNLPDCLLVIAGGKHPKDQSSYLEFLRERINALGLDDRVRILGYLTADEMRGVLTATDIIAAPFLESFGSGSVSFAAAYYRPVIASDISYFQQLRNSGFGIELFKTGDASDFEKKVKSLLSDERSLARLSGLMQICADKYSYKNTAAGLLHLYDNIIKARKK